MNYQFDSTRKGATTDYTAKKNAGKGTTETRDFYL